jgi:hypothetical protein
MGNLLSVPLHQTLNKFKFFLNGFLIFIATVIVSFSIDLFPPIKAVPSGNPPSTVFYGNSKNPNKSGGEYIVFRLNNNIAKGLVYVQDSDVFSCFTGAYNRRNNSFRQITFAYPDMETGKWVKTKSDEIISLTDFPYRLNYTQISPGANNIFQDCLGIL